MSAGAVPGPPRPVPAPPAPAAPAQVADAEALLGQLPARPLEEHPAGFEEVHRLLSGALALLDER